jgi:hypothetical protein
LRPSFSPAILKELVPLFTKIAEKVISVHYPRLFTRLCMEIQVTGSWQEIVQDQSGSSSVIDVYSWFSRLTLDTIGQGLSQFPSQWLHN